MLYLTYILQFVVDRFNDRTLPQQYLIAHCHQAVFHVVPDLGDELHPIDEEELGELFADIALIGKQLPEDPVQEPFALQRGPIIGTGLSDGEIEYFALVVYDDVQLEAMEPAHGRFPRIGNSLEDFVAANALIFADADGRGIYERNPRALSQTAGFQEQGQGHQVLLHQFCKPIVRNGIWELVCHVLLKVEQVEMFERPKSAQLKDDHNGDDLAFGHYRWALWRVADEVLIDELVIFFAKFVDDTENFSNFRIDYHR